MKLFNVYNTRLLDLFFILYLIAGEWRSYKKMFKEDLLHERYFFTASNHISKEWKKTAFTNFCPLKSIESYPYLLLLVMFWCVYYPLHLHSYTVINFVQSTLYSFLLGLYSKYTRIQPMGVVCQRRQNKILFSHWSGFPDFRPCANL